MNTVTNPTKKGNLTSKEKNLLYLVVYGDRGLSFAAVSEDKMVSQARVLKDKGYIKTSGQRYVETAKGGRMVDYLDRATSNPKRGTKSKTRVNSTSTLTSLVAMSAVIGVAWWLTKKSENGGI